MADHIRTPVDDIPIEVRRLNWGWFGEPWPSGVCYGDDGRLLEEMRKPFPTGEQCLYCTEVFDEAAGDSGQATPFQSLGGPPEVRHAHKECLLRQVTGSIAHLQGHCSCQGGDDAPDLSYRQDALAVWAWVEQYGGVRG
jgi:hypothetical protein